MTRAQFARKYARFKIGIVPNVGPRRYSVEVAGSLSVLGTCDTIAEAVTLADDWLLRPETHAYEQDPHFSAVCRVCGESPAAHES